jgi:hypothetical protein
MFRNSRKVRIFKWTFPLPVVIIVSLSMAMIAAAGLFFVLWGWTVSGSIAEGMPEPTLTNPYTNDDGTAQGPLDPGDNGLDPMSAFILDGPSEGHVDRRAFDYGECYLTDGGSVDVAIVEGYSLSPGDNYWCTAFFNVHNEDAEAIYYVDVVTDAPLNVSMFQSCGTSIDVGENVAFILDIEVQDTAPPGPLSGELVLQFAAFGQYTCP